MGAEGQKTVVVTLTGSGRRGESSQEKHRATHWLTDNDEHLNVMDDSTLVATYARGEWVSARIEPAEAPR